jgi:hypothetical protein
VIAAVDQTGSADSVSRPESNYEIIHRAKPLAQSRFVVELMKRAVEPQAKALTNVAKHAHRPSWKWVDTEGTVLESSFRTTEWAVPTS